MSTHFIIIKTVMQVHASRQFKNIPPSDFLHGLLCLHFYQNSQPNDPVEFPPQQQQLHSNNQYLTKWKIKNVFQFDEFEPF